MAEHSSSSAVGSRVAAGLAVLTVLEYLAAIAEVPGLLVVLAAFAVAKAWLIVSYFMHIGQLRREES